MKDYYYIKVIREARSDGIHKRLSGRQDKIRWLHQRRFLMMQDKIKESY